MRLFAAIRPPEPVLQHLELALSLHRNGIGAGLRWTPEEQLHVTTAFFGAVPDGAVGDIEAALASVAATTEPIDMSLRGAGSFAGRSLWIGVAGDTDRLVDLMAAGTEIDHAQQRDRHRAHLTVARPSRRATGGEFAPLVHALAVYAGPAWRAGSLELFSSKLGQGRSGGPLHELIASLPFGG